MENKIITDVKSEVDEKFEDVRDTSGLSLIKRITPRKDKIGNIIPPEIDVKTLNSIQRRSIVFFMLKSGRYHQQEIADLLGYSATRICQLNKELKESYIDFIDGMEIKKEAGLHIQRANTAYIELNKQGKWKEAWEVTRELIQDLQSLGYIHKEPEKININYEERAKAWDEFFGIGNITIIPNANITKPININSN